MPSNSNSLESSIKQQLLANRSKNLLFENARQIMDTKPGFLAALEELLNAKNEDIPENIHTEIVSFTANELVKRLLSVNPYLGINDQHLEELKGIYLQTWQTMKRTGDIQRTLKEFHYPELSKWLALLYPEKFRNILKDASTVGSVIYGEYSAELQIELLGIDIARVKQPVLDIGCGSHASLARYLRSQSIEAYGIDRHLEVRKSYLEQEDWFEYSFKPNSWGTLISNMGFTNHLNYAYLHDVSQLERYLLKMNDILASLSINGHFHYAPSLPFVEEKLSAKEYHVERIKAINEISTSIVTKIV
jgi:hypothetical protein